MTQKTEKHTTRLKALKIAELQADKKAENIIVINVTDICNFTEYFVISTGLSTLQIKALSDHIQETLRKQGHRPFHIDGQGSSTWTVMDYDDVIVHIFSPEARSYFDLERLWGDGEIVDWESELNHAQS